MPNVNEAMDQFIASFNREDRDLDMRETFLASEVVISDWMAPGVDLETDAAAAEAFYEPILRSFPDVRFEVTDSMREANRLLILGFFNGTMQDEYWGFPSHGRQVRWEARDLYRFNNDGLIDRIWFANDTLTVARELGAEIDDARLW